MPLECRSCAAPLAVVAVDLGLAPRAGRFPRNDVFGRIDPFHPLRVFVCERCLLLQVEPLGAEEDEFDSDYAWFSSASTAWLEHARAFSEEVSQGPRPRSGQQGC